MSFIKHEPGDPMPVAPDTMIEARLEDGYLLAPMRADEISWDCPGDNVIEYRIISKGGAN